ncbi:hypothetical protein E2C01_097640 [Portunus trituberculatus]|uniref:Uncharacterized protein n=1 Tax=Portunus trituberculatus TaxID=210409 RepID=A0A5B7JVQ0_PORTR|nr:hypothetical protein [Portunus trituberculatus]
MTYTGTGRENFRLSTSRSKDKGKRYITKRIAEAESRDYRTEGQAEVKQGYPPCLCHLCHLRLHAPVTRGRGKDAAGKPYCKTGKMLDLLKKTQKYE